MTAILLGTTGIYGGALPTLNTFYASVWAGGAGGGGAGDKTGTRDEGEGAGGGTGAFGEIKIEGLTANHRLKFTVGAGGIGGDGSQIGGEGGNGGLLSSVVLADADGSLTETLLAVGGGGGGGGGADSSTTQHGASGYQGPGGLLVSSSVTATNGGNGGRGGDGSSENDKGDAGAAGKSFAVTDVVDGTFNSTVHSGVVVTLLAAEAGNLGSLADDTTPAAGVGTSNHFNSSVAGAGGIGGRNARSDGNPGSSGKIVYGFTSATTNTDTTQTITVDPSTLTGAT